MKVRAVCDSRFDELSAMASASLVVARQWANDLGVPVAYLYADNADLAELILAFGLLTEHEQHRLAAEVRARVSAPTASKRVPCPERSGRRTG